MSATETFLWSVVCRAKRRLPLALAASALAAAVVAGMAFGAATPNGLVVDSQSGRDAVASTLRALGARGSSVASNPRTQNLQGAAADPVATPAISAPPDTIVGEADRSVTLTVRLNAPGIDQVTVNYATANSTASSGSCNNDYVQTSGQLVFAPGQVSKDVNVDIHDCPNADPFESFRFNLNTAVSATIQRASTLVSIVDNSTVVTTPRLHIRNATVDEKDDFVLVPVLLGGPKGQSSSSTVSVNYTTANGTATAGTDYTAQSGTLTFLPGQTVKNIVVQILHTGPRPTRSFSVTLGSPSSATVSDGTALVVIGASTASPVASPAVSAPPDMIAGEGDGYIDLPVRLSAPGIDTVSVDYETDAITASSGIGCDFDYVSVNGTLKFAPGETTKVVRIQLEECNDADGFVTFDLTLTSAVSASIARASTLVGLVNNSTSVATPRLHVRDTTVDVKDGVAVVPVLLGGPAGQSGLSSVTVNYTTANGTATSGTDYSAVSGTLTFAPGQTVKNVVVPLIDLGPKPTRRFTVNLSGATGGATIVDGIGTVVVGASTLSPVATPTVSAAPDMLIGEADGYVDVPVRLSAPGQNLVQVSYSTANASANTGTFCPSADYVGRTNELLNFAPGETTKVVRIQVLDCDDINQGLVSFRLNLTAATNASISRASTLVSIVNNATQVATPRVHVRDATVDEKDGSVLVPVILGGTKGQTPSGGIVSVDYATANGTATAGTDYTAVSGTLNFAPGQTVKTIVVPILDPGPRAPKSFTVNLSSPVSATIIDGRGTVVIGSSSAVAVASPAATAPPDVIAGENDGYVDLPVRLSAPGQNPVQIAYSTNNSTASSGSNCTSDYVTASGTLNFAPGETTKVVRVQLLDCTDVEGLVSFTFTLGTTTNATVTRPTTLVSILDDSTSVVTPPRIHVRDATVDEKDGSVLVPVLLGGTAGQTSTSNVTVNYTTANGTATAGNDYGAVSGTLTFAPGQTVKNIVVPIVDLGAKPTRNFTVALSSPTNGTIIDGTGTITIGSSTAVAVSSPILAAPADVIVGEGDGYMDLVVRMSAPGINRVQVDYDTSGATASSSGSACNSDYVNASGTLTFVPGETTKVVRVQLLDCNDTDGFVSFRFTLTNPTNATIARPNALVSIVSNSTSAATPQLVVRDAIADQKDGSVLVPVLLGGPAGQATDSTVTVQYTTSDGTATAGVDYTPVSGTLSFAPGQTAKNIVVPLTDVGSKPTRNFSVNLSNITNASLADATATVVIGASAAAAVATPAISAAPDVAVEEGGGYVDLPVTLSTPGLGAVTVTVATANGSATFGTGCNADYVAVPTTVLTFAPGETMKIVRVQLIDCPDVESTENFRLNLTLPGNATIADPQTTITIVNNNTAFTPNNTSLPTITGTTLTGQMLTAGPGQWTGAPTSYSYAWQRCNSSGGGCGTITNATGATYQLVAADGGHTIRVEVTATNALGTSLPAYSAATSVVLSVPSEPLNVTATSGDGKAFVSFSPPANDGGGILFYTVTVSPGGAQVTGAGSPITINGLTNGVVYTFTVTATNSVGTGPPSARSNFVVPAKPRPAVPDPPPPSPRAPVPEPPPPVARPPVPPLP